MSLFIIYILPLIICAFGAYIMYKHRHSDTLKGVLKKSLLADDRSNPRTVFKMCIFGFIPLYNVIVSLVLFFAVAQSFFEPVDKWVKDFFEDFDDG